MPRCALVMAICCLAIGCNDLIEKSDVEFNSRGGQSIPLVVARLIDAINRHDWDEVSKLAKQGARAKGDIEKWKKSPILVSELRAIQNDAELDGIPCSCYSYGMGPFHPHQFEIFVRKKGNRYEIVDFYEMGW